MVNPNRNLEVGGRALHGALHRALRRLLAGHLEVAYGGVQRRVAREARSDTVALELLAA